MADVTDPKIDEAYQDVRNDKTETNYLILEYEGRTDKLKVAHTGSGGLAEFKDLLPDDQAAYVYARISYANDKESKREKFILVTWIGPSCGVMRKAKMSVQTADVKKKLHQYSIDVAAEGKDDLQEEPIVVRLRKAGGASYDGV